MVKKWRTVGIYVLLLLTALWSLGPIIFIGISSIRDRSEQYTTAGGLLPEKPTLESYRYVLAKEDVPGAALNSVVISLAATLIALLSGSLAGYSLSRHHPGGLLMSYVLLVSRMIPTVALSVPLFMIGKSLDLVDRYIYIILIYAFLMVALVAWIMKTHFDGIPKEIEESARLDGCTAGQLLTRIVFPLARPGMAACAVLALVQLWNEFALALVLTRSNTRTLPVAVSTFVTIYAWEWGYMAAAAVLIAVPVIFFAVICQKYMVAGLTAGSMK